MESRDVQRALTRLRESEFDLMERPKGLINCLFGDNQTISSLTLFQRLSSLECSWIFKESEIVEKFNTFFLLESDTELNTDTILSSPRLNSANIRTSSEGRGSYSLSQRLPTIESATGQSMRFTIQ